LGFFLNFQGKVDHRAIMEHYRTGFKPSAELAEPRCNVAVAGICAETEQRAKRLLEDHRGIISVVPTVVGSPQQCRDELELLRSQCGVDEIIFLDLCRRFEDRLHSYELLAAEIGLIPPKDDSALGEDVDKLSVTV
jgi:alkanesulfonate monooxygenase SsuD/methylene tetrahydromethanopterin reductase-like flavin-dependent oxidoreductase (luciferase family)